MTPAELMAAPICSGGRIVESGWTTSSALVVPLAAAAALYAAGAMRLWHRSVRGRPARLRESLLFAAGWSVLALALLSPLHLLGERLFTAHMLEHELLMAVAAPLLVLSRPGPVLLWGLPRRWRQRLAGSLHGPLLLGGTWRFISRPAVATLLHGAAIWLWHIPTLFEAALAQGTLHYLQHASFFGTGLLFWQAMLPPAHRRNAHGSAVMHLFFTATHTGLLGVLLVLAPRLWYPSNFAAAASWQLTPLEDQQLAGLVMWVPAGLVYAGAALAVAALWVRMSNGLLAQEPAHGFEHA